MNDADFCKWFAERGHKWRGWPEWIDDSESFGVRIANEERGWLGIFASPDGGLDESLSGYITEHEAACLIRDFLLFHPDLQEAVSSGEVFSREGLNYAFRDALEQAMKKEGVKP